MGEDRLRRLSSHRDWSSPPRLRSPVAGRHSVVGEEDPVRVDPLAQLGKPHKRIVAVGGAHIHWTFGEVEEGPTGLPRGYGRPDPLSVDTPNCSHLRRSSNREKESGEDASIRFTTPPPGSGRLTAPPS